MFTLLVAVNLLNCHVCLGQGGRRELALEQILRVRSLADFPASLSTDGRWLAYVVQDPRRETDLRNSPESFASTGAPGTANGTDVWVTNVHSGQSRNISGGVGANWGVSWSPDGHTLAFYSDRDGKPRLWLYDAEKKSMRRLSGVVVRPLDSWQLPSWKPDGTELLTKVVAIDPLKGLLGDNVGIIPTEDSHLVAPESKTRVYRSSGVQASNPPTEGALLVQDSQTRAEHADLARINVSTGVVRTIARNLNPVWYSWSPNGTEVALATMKGLQKGEVYRELFDLLIVSESGDMRVIDSDISRVAWDFSATWSPNGDELSYVSTGVDEDGECFIVPLTGRGRRRATMDVHPPFSPFHRPPLWDRSKRVLYLLSSTFALWSISLEDGSAREVVQIPGHRIYAIVSLPGGRPASVDDSSSSILVSTLDDASRDSGFYRIDLSTGQFKQLRSEHKSYDPYRVTCSNNGMTIIYSAEDVAHPADFFVSNTDFTNSRQLTNINAEIATAPHGDSLLVRWRTGDGETVQGALLLPSGYQRGTRYPLVVEVYPSLFSPCVNQFGLCGENFFPNKQLLATRGYAVLMPDIRLRGKSAMSDLANIVLPGINATIEQGIVDNDRVAIMGTSWGGYAALALIVQTTRFKAAVTIAGFGDLTGFYGEMDETGSSLGIGILEQGRGQLRMSGTPWQYRTEYIENSPIFYLDRMNTPLLMFHGTSDRNVASFLSDEVFTDLRRLNKEVTYVKYVGETHGIYSYKNQVDCARRIVDWLSTYLGGRKDQHGMQSQN